MADFFYIVSQVGHNLVMDLSEFDTAPGTPIITYWKKSVAQSDNQLWRKVNRDQDTFFLESKVGVGNRIAIKDGTAVISEFGALFKQESADGGAVMYIVNSSPDNVLEVKDSSTNAWTPIVSGPKTGGDNQKWDTYMAGQLK